MQVVRGEASDQDLAKKNICPDKLASGFADARAIRSASGVEASVSVYFPISKLGSAGLHEYIAANILATYLTSIEICITEAVELICWSVLLIFFTLRLCP